MLRGGKNGEQLLKVNRVSFWPDENALKLDSGDGCATL